MPIASDSINYLTVLTKYHTHPGEISADTYIPKDFPKNGPLVVVLHAGQSRLASCFCQAIENTA